MEIWREYCKGLISKHNYRTKLSFGEESGLSVELRGWVDKFTKDKKITIDFGDIYSMRIFDEGIVQQDIFGDISMYKKEQFANVIYEVEDGNYTGEVKRIAGRKLEGADFYQYTIVTINYNIEIVTKSEPIITVMKGIERFFSFIDVNNKQKKVDLIFKHLEEPVYMSKSGSYYEAEVELTKGEYYYKYLGEDGLELIDKTNKDIFIDESGCWSVLTIDEDGVVEKEIESSATLIEYGISHKKMEVVSDKAESKVFYVNKDKEAVCLLSFNEIKGLHVVTVAWYNPSGELYKFAENDFGSYEEADDDKVMVRFWLNLAGIDEADFGNWTVRAFLDGEMIKEDNIIISGDGIKKLEYED